MPNYHRANVPGARYFFTVVTARRRPLLDSSSIDVLRRVVENVQKEHPFGIDGWVVLPEHMHAIWRMPEDDPTNRNDGESSNLGSPGKAVFQNAAALGSALRCGSHGFGSTPSEMKWIGVSTWTICISTQSSTGWSRECAIGRSPAFIRWCVGGSMRTIGESVAISRFRGLASDDTWSGGQCPPYIRSGIGHYVAVGCGIQMPAALAGPVLDR